MTRSGIALGWWLPRAGLVAALGCTVIEDAAAAETRHPARAHPARRTKPAETAAAAPPAAENLVVHGQKHFTPAPMPNPEIHDPSDPTVGRFGGAFNDANPVPAVNPGLQGDQSPVTEGIQR